MSKIKDDIDEILTKPAASVLGDELPYKLQIAAASLLVYAAKADGTFSENELDSVMRALAKEFKHPDHYSAEMIEVASYLHQNKKKLQDFTSLINASLAQEQKEFLFDLISKVIKSDGRVSVAEKVLVTNLSNALGIGHR